ncbi:hypothetical protein FGKAn22_12380 [Ferrigenium kumadai]|uniref:Cellulose biosynthesis protein BcsE n=1 Tax=Ferrigenium kumadai TaxID=1682490 RepID=A0AAN1VZM8_9PROT|nr:hypothetical protein FGKAn22_12380 [Ferrigenium kumadai]
MATGRVYVVTHDAELGLDVACTTLVAACASGHAEWITKDPSSYLGLPAVLSGEVAECLHQGDLRIFRIKAGDRGVCVRILKELDFIGVAQGSLILVEGADSFVVSESVDTDAAAWQQWAERSGCTVLWMCPRPAGQPDHEADFLRLAHRFSGLSRLRKRDGNVHWDVYYWFADGGVIADKSFRLDTDGHGSWWVDQRGTLNAEAAERAVDEDDVFVTRAALPGGRSAPDGWRVFETAEQMKEALSSARAPTVVINYSAGSPLEMLARLIFEVRRSIGPQIKIAVKEDGGRLRHSHEQLLLNLGANLVIPSETGFARMQSLLKSIQGQTFSGALPPDFEEAMTSVVAVEQAGYVAPANFMGAVSNVMERAQVLGIHNALVRLSLTPGLGILETLRYCIMKRPGDLCTADDESIYVFLFACEEQDIGATLDRLFRLPVSVLFTAESRFLSAEDITGALAEFNLRATEAHYEDFTAALASGAPPTMQPSAGYGPAVAAGRTPIRPPFSAMQHALKLRTVHP